MGKYLQLDISDVQETIDALRAVHTPEQFERLMYRVFSRAGGRVKTILKKEIPKEYHVTSSYVGSQIGAPRTSFGGGGLGVNCCIPIDGHRGSIGGLYSATGGRHGWNSTKPIRGKKVGKRYKINAKIVKSGTSKLPSTMSHQGGNPPFRNFGSKLNGVAFTRVGKERFPIAKVVGLGVPQMPLNRSKESVQEEIRETLEKRLEHEHAWLISRCR